MFYFERFVFSATLPDIQGLDVLWIVWTGCLKLGAGIGMDGQDSSGALILCGNFARTLLC